MIDINPSFGGTIIDINPSLGGTMIDIKLMIANSTASKDGLKAQCATEPRASAATPWVTPEHKRYALKGQK